MTISPAVPDVPSPIAAPNEGDGQLDYLANLRFRLDRFDRQISIEFTLIGDRMNWLMTSQAFLFAAFAVCITAQSPRFGWLVSLLEYMLVATGTVSAWLVGRAIRAAHTVVDGLKRKRARLEFEATAKGFEELGVDVSSVEHRAGNTPSLYLPWWLFAVWLFTLGGLLGTLART
jgi:hypothetical protein